MAFGYPVSLELSGRRCVVIGTGPLAEEKAAGLLEAGADVVTLSAYENGDLEGAFLAVVTDPDRDLHASVAVEAREKRVLLNCMDDIPYCDFAAPSIVRRGDLRISISTGGKAPALAKRLRLQLTEEIDEAYAELVDLLGEVRAETIGDRADFETWRRRWQHALDQPLLEMVREGRVDEAKDLVRRCLTQDPGPRPAPRKESPRRVRRWVGGGVSIVGAGPGDPGLITVRGAELIAIADVIVYDRLVHPDLVASKRAIYVGKQSGRHCVTQGQINDLLVRLARGGEHVVRLKGGDPFVFGRGAEEARALAHARLPFEIVPAPTSAIAAPAYAGIPITERSVASSVAFVTGRAANGMEPRWTDLATSVDTIVILMAGQNLGHIAKKLIEGGRPPETPAAVIENGTMENQRVTSVTLEDLERLSPSSPSLVVVGDAAGLREHITWFPQGSFVQKTTSGGGIRASKP